MVAPKVLWVPPFVAELIVYETKSCRVVHRRADGWSKCLNGHLLL